MLVLTGGAATACSLYKHSLPRPLHVLWGWQFFYQKHPAALCRAGTGAVLFKSRGLAVAGLPWAAGNSCTVSEGNFYYKDGFVSFLELSNSFSAASVWSPVLEALEML